MGFSGNMIPTSLCCGVHDKIKAIMAALCIAALCHIMGVASQAQHSGKIYRCVVDIESGEWVGDRRWCLGFSIQKEKKNQVMCGFRYGPCGGLHSKFTLVS